MRTRLAVLSLLWSCQLLAADDSLSLVALYDASRLNDATYKVADHDYAASREEIAIGRSGLLPQVAINSRYGHGGQLEKRTTNNTSDDQYSADSIALSVSQPLFDKDAGPPMSRQKPGQNWAKRNMKAPDKVCSTA